MQISSRSKSVKFGVISLWALTFFIIVFIVVVIGKNQKLFSAKYSIYMFVPNAQGLNPGAFITLSGLKVGVVGEMKFTRKDEQQGILVELKIKRDYAKMITTSSVATINTMGMLGDKYIDISLGNLSDPELNQGSFINTTPALDLGLIALDAATAIREFQAVLKNLNRITEDAVNESGVLGMLIKDKTAQQNLTQLIANLNHISNQIKNGEGNLGQFVQDSTLYVSLNRTATHLDHISSKIQNGEGSLGRLVADTTFYVRLNAVTVLADSLLNGLQRGEGTTGKLMKDEQLFNQLLLLAKSLNVLTDDIKNNPKKYVTIKVF